MTIAGAHLPADQNTLHIVVAPTREFYRLNAAAHVNPYGHSMCLQLADIMTRT